jgi:hypothetical protein
MGGLALNPFKNRNEWLFDGLYDEWSNAINVLLDLAMSHAVARSKLFLFFAASMVADSRRGECQIV